jgi:dephospho-CoA kinase
MIIIGLTGSIAMGKTTVGRQFAKCGAAVCDSDSIVHKLLDKNGTAVEAVGKAFPHTLKGNRIDRKALGKEVFGDEEKLRQLEAILHPLVHKAQDEFIRRARTHRKSVIVLDIPLLFETKGEDRCDYTVVVSAPEFLQKNRVLKRGISHERFKYILERQMKSHEKRKRADFIVFTGIGKYNSLKAVRQIMKLVKEKENGTDKRTGKRD